ncbi:MAG: hypothetical protein SR2Q5_03455 [Quinella sp. 2Q5]|nr:hypothetical protein [Quinella sp. 2Q5]
MRKIFAALMMCSVLWLTATAQAAKLTPLAEIDAYGFYQNMGYEVDCSHFERIDRKMVFRTILPEEPLALSKELPNVVVHVDPRSNHVVEVDLYLDADAEKNSQATFVAKVIAALDEAAFQKNQPAIERGIGQFVDAPTYKDIVVTIDETRRYKLYKEIEAKVLAIYIEAAD